MTCDSHQMTFSCHDITQQRQVSVVDVGAVKGDDMIHLFLNGLSHSFNTKSRKNFYNIIGCCSDRINIPLAENSHEGRSVSLKDPLSNSLELSLLSDEDPLLVISVGKMHVHLCYGLYSLQ